MKKLPNKIKKRWISALTSGEYEQGVNTLYNSYKNSYCCIGVLGVVCGVPKESISSQPVFNEDYTPKLLDKIPEQLIGGTIRYSDDYNELVGGLTELNDAGVPFEVIAGFINENL